MTRETSIAVYRQIDEEGLLKKLQMKVYSIVFRHGPMSARMAQEIFNDESNSEKHNDVVDQRMSELKRFGVIRELPEKRICESSGRRVLWWDVTENLPKKEKKGMSKALIITNIVNCGKKMVKSWRRGELELLLLDMEKLLDELEVENIC